ncbi:MAG: hypothetical protein ACLQNE_22885 [Thermoguttaceae bacterium]
MSTGVGRRTDREITATVRTVDASKIEFHGRDGALLKTVGLKAAEEAGKAL